MRKIIEKQRELLGALLTRVWSMETISILL